MTTLKQVYDQRDVAKPLKKLLKKLLAKKPEKRMTALELINNKWIRGGKRSNSAKKKKDKKAK